MSEPLECYVNLADGLKRRFVEACYQPAEYEAWRSGKGFLVDDNWTEVALWMCTNLRPCLQRSSWRSYVSAVKAVADDSEVAAIFDRHKHVRDSPGAMPGTTANRSKGVTAADLRKLTDWVAERRLVWGAHALTWLYATVYTGLRPAEWTTAQLISIGGGSLGLQTATLKTANRLTKTDDDTAGDTRTIPLHHLDDEGIDIVRSQLDQVDTYGSTPDEFSRFYRGCINVLSRASSDIRDRSQQSVSLYSGRHAFHAACYAKGLSAIEIAVLMGHDSIDTSKHYGKGANKFSFQSAPTPLPEDVNAWKCARKGKISA